MKQPDYKTMELIGYSAMELEQAVKIQMHQCYKVSQGNKLNAKELYLMMIMINS
jgi:hypothetical protein